VAGVTVTGVPEWKAGLRRLLADLDDVTRRTTGDGALLVEREAKLTLRLRSHPFGTPTPSPKGSPPALIFGSLMRSVETRPPQADGRYRWTSQAGPTIVYGRIQELGGWAGRGHRTYIPYRPYLLPATIRARGPVRNLYQERWAEVLARV
jgi:hypothetical protein